MKMIRLSLKKTLIVCLMVLVCAPQVLAADLLSPDNPYLNIEDTGSADAVNVIGAVDDTNTKDGLINVIKGGVNWVLGILALIALIILLWGGFLMVTASGNEERYNKGWTILKQAAIGLTLIGVAWFIISIIFWLINLTTSEAGDADTQN